MGVSSMHSVLIAGSFIAMVLAPCVVATCSKFFRMRVKIRIRSRGPKVEAVDPVVARIRMQAREQALAGQSLRTR